MELVFFHWSGTMPWRTELLIIEVTGRARDVANSFKILWGTLSGPTALVSLILLSPVCTSPTSTIYSDGMEEGYLYKHSTFLHQELECAELPHKGAC